MFSTALAAAGGLASFFGQRSANDANRSIANATNTFSARQAQINRDWQERMSNTSWQRGVADMRAAGINPMLAVSQGGASQPTGSAPSGNVGHAQRDVLFPSFSSAVSTLNAIAQIDNLSANAEKARAEAVNSRALNPVSKALTETTAKAVGYWDEFKDELPKAIGGLMYDAVNSAKSVYKKATTLPHSVALDFSRLRNQRS